MTSDNAERPPDATPVPADPSQAPAVLGSSEERGPTEAVSSPAKVMRIGAMVRQLLEEVRHAPLDEAGRARMREIYEISVRELASGLSPDLADELSRVALPLREDTPSEAELRVAQAQLVGWLEGLFHGIQATLFAQQAAARNQLEEMRRRALPAPSGPDDESSRSGLYL